MSEITKSMSVAEIVQRYPQARQVFDRHGLHGCGGDHGPAETLEFFARVHLADLDEVLRELNVAVDGAPAAQPYAYHETLGDYIYRRFFKAGIAIALTIGGLWGVILLIQVALGKELLQPRLVDAIHAHAHAMIFGWVGLFVMGFAYQSFPRFKFTTLWRPDLANLSFYLMLGGIGARVVAEMLQRGPAALATGLFSAVAEFAAISLFVLIILRTAAQSMQPHNPYEKFIFAALAWFLIQALFSDVFFFANATATSPDGRFWRIAVLDAPLREVQLLGFASLIIAGVSLRFIPVVYGLGKSAHDRVTLIFELINGSLLLNVVCFMGLLETGNLLFAAGLEIAYCLEALWALLLVIQLRIFTRTTEPDRSWKFIRAAYVWLLIAGFMMPLMILYDRWTGQFFSHAYAGARLHAFTVGFVSLMMVGVASRVVPILAGVDSKQVSSLWGPFLLLNTGCAGRVGLQILTDLRPGIAYSLIGFTGCLELAGLAWWGIGLWRTMSLAKTHRARVLQAPLPLAAR